MELSGQKKGHFVTGDVDECPYFLNKKLEVICLQILFSIVKCSNILELVRYLTYLKKMYQYLLKTNRTIISDYIQ
jgi:hypothetical protein